MAVGAGAGKTASTPDASICLSLLLDLCLFDKRNANGIWPIRNVLRLVTNTWYVILVQVLRYHTSLTRIVKAWVRGAGRRLNPDAERTCHCYYYCCTHLPLLLLLLYEPCHTRTSASILGQGVRCAPHLLR